MHGGKSPNAIAAREARIAVAEAQAKGGPIEARDLGDVLVAAVQDSDAMAQRIKALIENGGEELKPSELRAYGEWLDRAGRLSKSALDVQLDERKVRVTELQTRQLFEIVTALVIALGHDPTDPAVIDAVRACAEKVGDGRPPVLTLARSEVVITPDQRSAVSRRVSGVRIAPSEEPDTCSPKATTARKPQSPSAPQGGS